MTVGGRRWVVAAAVAGCGLLLLAGCTSAPSIDTDTDTGSGTGIATTATTTSPTGSSSATTSGPAPSAPATVPLSDPSAPDGTPTGVGSAVPSNSAAAATTASLAPGVSDEASGIAAAGRTPGAWFLVDDATGTDSVVAVTADGTLIARVPVVGMSADNAEALAAGSCGPLPLPGDDPGESCFYVGDIGDNAAEREDIAVFRFAEPALTDGAPEPVADEWRYTYPDGPHNAEGMILDPDGSLLVVTKPAGGELPHRIYRGEPGGGELVLVKEFRPPTAERPLRTLLTGNVVTDLGFSPGRVLLLTYDEAIEYTSPDQAADPASFPDWPYRRLSMPGMAQAEGIAGAADGCGYAVASEGGPGGGPGSLSVMSCK